MYFSLHALDNVVEECVCEVCHHASTVRTQEVETCFIGPSLTFQRGRACFGFSWFIKTIVINIITLYLCKFMKFENKAIFVMSFSQSVGKPRCIYIYYRDRFSDMLFTCRGSLFPLQGLEAEDRSGSSSSLNKSTYCSVLSQDTKHFLESLPPLHLEFLCVSNKS